MSSRDAEESGTISDTLTRQDPRTVEPGHDERRAHIVHSNGKAADKVFASFVEGTPVEALCGRVFVPSRDASRYPVCEECKAIKDELQGRSGSGS